MGWEIIFQLGFIGSPIKLFLLFQSERPKEGGAVENKIKGVERWKAGELCIPGYKPSLRAEKDGGFPDFLREGEISGIMKDITI